MSKQLSFSRLLNPDSVVNSNLRRVSLVQGENSIVAIKNTNFLLTEREGRTGEYWPEVVAAVLDPYKNDRGPIFLTRAWAS